MKNLLLTLSLFLTSLVYSQNVIIDTFNCQGASSSFTQTAYVALDQFQPPLSTINCDSILSAHLFWVNFPTNLNDSIQTWWDISTTSLVTEPFSFMFPPYTFTQSGCYRYDLVFICQPSFITTVLTSTWYVSTVGINELCMNQRKVIKVIDMMGQTTELTPNRLLIKCYSDGTTERVYINQ